MGQSTTASQLRSTFLFFFEERGHTIVPSSPLIPAADPTLMFTNAGMVQFKDVFVGKENRPYKRATTAQKCMRVSGKHNDLEEVGRTARHQTLFEMLGNFSFGDYFKEEAIAYAWEFTTKTAGLSPERLWVTYFGGEGDIAQDEQARDLWKKISGLPDERIVPMGLKDNFWAMGDTGPCGPCTEIHYDLDPTSPATPEDFESGRIVEFWNNVFMQFERKPSGELAPLPAPSVDTGMGLERLAALIQGVTSNYDTDLFKPLLQTISEASQKPYGQSDREDDVSMRVIADHARATAFLVADGIQPSNEGRGYVMRRIMRRAIRHGRRLGFDDLFFHSVCDRVVDLMGEHYTELQEARALIEKVSQVEEEGFRRTLDTGLRILEDAVEQTKSASKSELPGEVVFKLYDTYGFPADLTEIIAEENKLKIDHDGFEQAMQAQRERSRSGAVGDAAIDDIYKDLAKKIGPTPFLGYPHETALESREGEWRTSEDGQWLETRTKVAALIQDKESTESSTDGELEVVLCPTPFYGESGGQVGDPGRIDGPDGTVEVVDTQKPVDGFMVSKGTLKGSLRVGDEVWAGYRVDRRQAVRAHHSATHLLHAALREELGSHVKQAGSLVDAEHLRFDFSHFSSLSRNDIEAIEKNVNARIQHGDDILTETLPFEEAKKKGALALFGEKYGDTVRVITMGSSIEFCGGTHAHNTQDIALLVITREEAIASGVRRIEAQVGAAARTRVQTWHHQLEQLAAALRGSQPAQDAHPVIVAAFKLAERVSAADVELPQEIRVPALLSGVDYNQARTIRHAWLDAVEQMQSKGGHPIAPKSDPFGILRAIDSLQAIIRDLDKDAAKQRAAGFREQADSLVKQAKTIQDVRILATSVEGADGKSLREMADHLRPKLGSGILCLGADAGGKAALLVAVSDDLTKTFRAGDLIREISVPIGGRGGGKPNLAQAGGPNPSALPQAYAKLEEIVRSHFA